MHHRSRSEAGEISSPRSSRAPSFSSDRPSLAGSVTFQMPSSVRPAPAYIAASVASQIVTDNHNAQLRDGADADHEDPSAGLSNALFSEQALYLLNAFLDHLLFAFLSTARSPSLTAIRPAITEVLKARLAREAMATADEELEGLLAGEDDEEFPAQEGREGEPWDVEKVWKRTRLRIMVYTRLGELEDDDEERYVQQERGLSMDENDDDEAGLVSWASAIFLTSIIEHVAEQTLLISGQAAFNRLSVRMRKMAHQSLDSEEQQPERLIVEDYDVEKVALNSALGRLWRTWRKRVRSPITPLSPRGIHSMSSFSSLHRRHISYDEGSIIDGVPEVPEYKPTETEIAANIPLPLGDNDINEIEVPGLARTFEEDESSGTQTPVTHPQRPSSAIILAPTEILRTRIAKERPLSVPPPARQPLVVPAHSEEAVEQELDTDPDDLPFETPMEAMSDDDSYIHDERQEGIHHEEDEADGEHEPDADMVAFAASTGLGFGMTPTVGPISTDKRSGFGKEEDDANTPTQATYGGDSRVLVSKRMSLEKPGPPGIVRTYSTRSSSLKSHNRSQPNSPNLTPSLEARSFLDEANSDEDLHGPEAIGVAHTSNVPIPTPSPPTPTEAGSSDKNRGHAKHPSHGGYVEVPPRQTAPTAIHVRSTPTPDGTRAPAETPTARKEGSRKDVPHREVAAAQNRSREVTPPRTRLSSLQELEPWQSKQQKQPVVPEKSARRRSPTGAGYRHGSPVRSRESPLPAPDRSLHLKTVEGSPRSRSGTNESPVDPRSSLKRVSSSSSSTAGRSVGTSILHSARDSGTSLDGRPRGLSGRMSEEDRQREFDSLVKGDETVKFTLTPQNMRDIDEPSVVKRIDSPKPSPKPASSVTVYPRVNADKDTHFGSQHLPSRTAVRSSGPTPSSSKTSMAKPLAREPRIQGESMRDFADFIRSTGPAPGDEKPVQRFALNGASAKPGNGSSSSIGGLGRKLSTRQTSSHSHSSSLVGDGPSAKPRIHMEPRSPAGQRSGNDDLIDFIRQGPPNSNNGQPRIPRSVAPFRTTVDSDQFDRMLDDGGNVESAYGSQVSTVSRQSSHTANSRTGLLPKQSVTQPAYSNTPQQLSGSMSNAEPQITRTRRRIKDPYAIDSDDEDEDLLTALPNSSKPTQREESMMDFLNSMDPPSNSQPQAFMLSPETIAAAKARAAQNGTSGHSSSNGLTSSPRNGVPGRVGKPGPVPSANIASTGTSNPSRGYKPRLQARAAATSDVRTGRSATNDLADFLRNSGPPEPPMPAPGASVRKEESKPSKAKFWRKKTYPDMP
ncbi:hypothetical protein N0V90_007645 [Kalmusia sp. IMI 367209]|nr:hypothetical protein N0V90_007645 [Kalmusia sp. IMI 367209]